MSSFKLAQLFTVTTTAGKVVVCKIDLALMDAKQTPFCPNHTTLSYTVSLQNGYDSLL